jgi:NADH-quinone oxidoreductase subunit F
VSHNLVSLRRKHAERADLAPSASPSILDALRDTMDAERVLRPDAIREQARALGVPDAVAHGVATYYSDLSTKPTGARRVHVCMGTACVASARRAHADALEEAYGVTLGETSADGRVSLEPAYCLGLCHAAPAVLVDEHGSDGAHLRHAHGSVTGERVSGIARGEPALLREPEPRPTIASFVTPTIVLRNVVDGADARTLAAARARGVYTALQHARTTLSAAQILDEVSTAGLRGRGGAGFSTAQKWRFAAQEASAEKYVVCNADEGDPGSYIDKYLLELDPHSVLEGMAIAGLAIGAAHGVIYLRSEYPRAAESLTRAIDEARAAGVLGAFDVRLVVGAGSYVCGEETALLHSIEGLRGVVTARPPFPAQSGLFERPTVVNNVETLINVPWIVAHGGAAYAALGLGKSRGTKAVSLNQLFARPGLYEVALGTSLRVVCEELGGGLASGEPILGVQIGGPLGGIIPGALLDVPLAFEELATVGGLLGHAGIVAFAERTDMRAIAEHLFEFGDAESCGKCFPCRLGMRRGLELVRRMTRDGGRESDLALLEELIETLELGSLCAHGGGLPAPIRSILQHWREHLLAPASAQGGGAR